MRLLNVHTLEFDEFHGRDIPRYVAASHRWHKGSEVTMKDIVKRRNTEKSGYKKVEGFARYVKDTLPHIEWLWIDTCCIRQDSDREVSEAVNSMFRWYRDSEICLAYLYDVDREQDDLLFARSEWFQRGWTLQELLAPNDIIFLGRNWQVLGHKRSSAYDKTRMQGYKGPVLTSVISHVTGIPKDVLHEYAQSYKISVEEKMRWTQGRVTTREEDISYCLLGIFDITMPIIYGEGKDKAFKRLYQEINRGDRPSTSKVTNPQDVRPARYGLVVGSSGRTLICSDCKRHFNSAAALEQHRQDSPAHAPIFTCGICEKYFNSKTALDQHLRSSSAHVPKFDCEMCQKSFNSILARDQHLSTATVHANKFLCSTCEKSFGNQHALDQHLQSSPVHARRFNCSSCERSFDSADALNQHVRDSPVHNLSK